MIFKNPLFISLVFVILIGDCFGQRRESRGPRDYEEELPTSRTGRTGSANSEFAENSLNNRTISFIPQINTNSSLQSNHSNVFSQPLSCSHCLDTKYLIHYYERGCKPVEDPESRLLCRKSCPKYFDCPKKEIRKSLKGCEYKGNVYKFREEVPVDNPCKKACFCDQNLNSKNISRPTITCADVECPFIFKVPDPNCYNVYEAGKCCPKEVCSDGQSEPKHKCLYNGKHYRIGEKIYPKEDPCVECTCNKNWKQSRPLNSTGCKRINCYLDSDNHFRSGCLPIYHENTCCPIQWTCPAPEEHHCVFEGRKYTIGESLNITRNKRIDCKCLIPPDFTCIEKVTKHRNVNRFETLHKTNATNTTNSPVNEFHELTQTSQCAPFIPEGLICAGVNCTTIIDGNGCQVCSCEQPCPTFKCKANCYLFATTPGVCPQCKCDD